MPKPPPAEKTTLIKRFLGNGWWQGVAGLVAIPALVFSAISVWPAEKPGNTNAGISTEGDGNTAVQGDNNCVGCELPPSSPPPPLEPLMINQTWPTLRGCDAHTAVAVLPGGPGPETIRRAPEEDLRVRLAAHGAATFGSGFLYIDLSVADGSTIQIANLRPVIFRKQAVVPRWVYAPQGGCGDTYARVFKLDLDKPSLTDAGIDGAPEMANPSEPPAPQEPLGSSFNVSKTEPAQIRVDVMACAIAGYEWGLDVTYIVRGEQRVKHIGTADRPYRVIGGLSTAVPSYDLSMEDPTQIRPSGSIRQPTTCV